MNIVIDCRYLNMSGIGRYLEGIVTNLPNNTYYFLGKKEIISRYINTDKIIPDETSPFSVKGLFINKKVNKYDLYFTPNFIIPLNVKIKVYAIIHDVIYLDYKDSTKNYLDYQIKKYLLKRALKKADKIFTVSNFTKSRINYHFPKNKKDIIVTYSGLSNSIINYKNKHHKVVKDNNSLIYVGNIKKHKGLITLLYAMQELPDYTLKIVGSKEKFRTGNMDFDKFLESPNIKFMGYLEDEAMYSLIENSSFLIQPSLYEGFGLPPLEALYLGTKPIISDISVFKEIYEDFDVTYFKKEDTKDLVEKIKTTSPKVDGVDSNKYSFSKISKTILGEDNEH